MTLEHPARDRFFHRILSLDVQELKDQPMYTS